MIINRKIAVASLALIVGLGCLLDGALAAKKKVTLEQAWKICRERVVKQYGTNTGSNVRSRYLLGASCMHEFGYDI